MRFDKVPQWVNWIAQDADGACWGYEAEPNQQHNGWYENEVGRIVKLGMGEPPADWTLTLTRWPTRPQGLRPVGLKPAAAGRS